jgi:hypothetical protein
VIGTHTPDFSFEHDIDPVPQARERAIDYPAVLDNDYALWSAFNNHDWPALHFVDVDGLIRDHHFGEGRYAESERVIQQLLGVERELVSVEGSAWKPRPTETTCARPRRNSATPQRALRVTGRRRVRQAPRLRTPRAPALYHWAPASARSAPENILLDQAAGSIATGSTRATRVSCSLPER